MSTHLSEKNVLAGDSFQVDGAIVEVTVLLETWQLTALETAARAQGLTAGALVRCLLRDYLASCEDRSRASCAKGDTLNPKASDCVPSVR